MNCLRLEQGIFAALLALLTAYALGCSAHNPFIIKNTTDTTAQSAQQFPAHNNKVFITAESLSGDAYEFIASIEVGRVWYGSSSKVHVSMADRARSLGADAVIEVRTWHQPAGLSWAAPHGSGKAVRLKDSVSISASSLKGDWL